MTNSLALKHEDIVLDGVDWDYHNKEGMIMLVDVDKCFTIKQVETITGIPRTSIRHYLNKGLITVEREENNVYYSYSYDDLIRLCQIAYYREIIDFPLDTISTLLKTSDIKIIEEIYVDQELKINERIRADEDKLNYIQFNQQKIEHLSKYKEKISLVPFETFYVFPFSDYFNVTSPIYPILYGAAEFSFDGKSVKKSKSCCIAFEKDLKYCDEKSAYELCTDKSVIKCDLSVYSIQLTQSEIDDPSLLLPMIYWATKHRFRIIDPVYLIHFFPFYKDEDSYKYVEAYLPIDVH